MIIFDLKEVVKRYIEERIEVAFFISTFPDASGADEGNGKGNTPKEEIS